ncbi:hypothetical protein LINPERPRIM_LOCUS20416, partial [Linum perenne]
NPYNSGGIESLSGPIVVKPLISIAVQFADFSRRRKDKMRDLCFLDYSPPRKNSDEGHPYHLSIPVFFFSYKFLWAVFQSAVLVIFFGSIFLLIFSSAV